MSTSRFLDIIMVTMDSDMSRKLMLANMDRARVSMKARIMLTSSSAEQYLDQQVNYMSILPIEQWRSVKKYLLTVMLFTGK